MGGEEKEEERKEGGSLRKKDREIKRQYWK